MTPLTRYEHDLQHAGFSPDDAQRTAAVQLQRIYDELHQPAERALLAPLTRLLSRQQRRSVRGLYLWGGVGRGKTHLVDAFFECLQFDNKLRMHFHRFMRYIHRELNTFKQRHDPLDLVAARFAEKARVICLDEFHVSDITDAMLLGNLLRALFDQNVTLVTTSNEPPDRLYWGGLQRDRFLPAIELLQRHTEVLNVDGGIDYRLRALERAEIYHWPLDAAASTNLEQAFGEIAPDKGEIGIALDIEGRPIKTVRCADGVVWFEFSQLCGGPRSATDYIELARCYQTVLLAGIPSMDDYRNDEARRFITLIDEFYDRNVKLVASGEATTAALYTGTKLESPFRRTASRLVEMQSHEYLARPHLSD